MGGAPPPARPIPHPGAAGLPVARQSSPSRAASKAVDPESSAPWLPPPRPSSTSCAGEGEHTWFRRMDGVGGWTDAPHPPRRRSPLQFSPSPRVVCEGRGQGEGPTACGRVRPECAGSVPDAPPQPCANARKSLWFLSGPRAAHSLRRGGQGRMRVTRCHGEDGASSPQPLRRSAPLDLWRAGFRPYIGGLRITPTRPNRTQTRRTPRSDTDSYP